MLLSFEDLVEKAKVDLDLNSDRLIDASANTGMDMVFYAEQRARWQEQRAKEATKLERISRFLWLYYSGKANAQQLEAIGKKTPFKLQLNNKQDIETFITSDSVYQDQQLKVNAADNTIKFLDEIVGAVRFRAQVVRNMIQEKHSFETN